VAGSAEPINIHDGTSVGCRVHRLPRLACSRSIASNSALKFPEVLEVHTITGATGMLCRVVARTKADLQRVLAAIVSAEGVVRFATHVRYRLLPLPRAATQPGL